MIWESPLAIRGGGPKESRKEEDDEDDEWEEVYDSQEEEEEQERGMEDELAEQAVEDELQETVEETEELVEEEEEESPTASEEEVQVVVEEAVATEEDGSTLEERSYTDDENFSSSFVDRMEARIANTNTDDENSSAFVDRMELADAYDEVDAVTDQYQEEDGALAAVTAATAIGGDDADPKDEAVAGEDAQDEPTAVQPTEISKEIKDTLKGLKYKSREINQLRPEVAAELAAKGLQRPQEGIPQNWFVEDASLGVSIREQALKISVVLAAFGGLAFVGAKGDIGGLIAGVPSVLKSLLPARSSAPMPGSKAALIAETDVSLVPAPVEEEEGQEDDHPHSVKPNSTSPPAYEEDLDKSLLDKVITKIGNLLKAFWNAKI
ncbi:unnamed protein product [Cylindrotheca closterium]|uniref:Uncharacterized protein n=1 Tax=Cylindrotheca closterium TaxID=2856 RepID=A0AAD2CRJ4_9STRA|nr:unnamed protein product [Cylindrotheca closterium]